MKTIGSIGTAAAAAAALFGALTCGRAGPEAEGGMKPTEQKVVRVARGAGRWFPAGAAELRDTVEGFIDGATVTLPATGRVVAVTSPHAGYVYSGAVAGYAFRALRERSEAETVVILGFSHRGAFPGVAFMDGDAIRTPLGEAPLDADALRILTAASPRIVADDRPHNGEHSAENQVPFVQVALPRARLAIGLIGDHEPATIRALADALRELAGRRAIAVVASTDLLHDPDWERVAATDRKTMALIAGLRTDELARSWSFENQVCCGIGPVLAAMTFAAGQGAAQGVILRYRNSGDDFPDSRGEWVVGYGAVAFVAP
jgi:AmmeMemoRadiSam system protein B